MLLNRGLHVDAIPEIVLYFQTPEMSLNER